MSVPRKRGKVKKKPAAVAKRPSKKSKKKLSGITKKRKRPIVSKQRPKPRKKGIPDASRSEAARRGWETRRSNRLKAQAQTSIDAHLAFLRQPKVAVQIRDQLIRTNLVRPGMVQTDETQILSRLIVAEQLGNFDETARDLAIEFDWNIRDVYTLWKSP